VSNLRKLVWILTITVAVSTIIASRVNGVEAAIPTHNVVFAFSPNKITAVDPNTLKSASIPVSNIMWGDVAVSPDQKLLFANDRTNNAVQVISVDSMKIVKTIPIGMRPVHMYNPKGGNEMWTHSDVEGTFYVIDVGSLAVTHKVLAASDAAKGGHGKLLWSAELGDKAYATNLLDHNLHVLSLSQYKETGIIDTGCKGTHGNSYNVPTKMVYIACNDGHVVVIDPAKDAVVATLVGGSQVWPGAHDPWMSEDSPFLVSPTTEDMKIIDTRTHMNAGEIGLKDAGYVVLHKVGGNLLGFTASNRMPIVYVLDVQAMKVAKRIDLSSPKAGGEELGPGGGDIIDHGGMLYVVSAFNGMLSFVDMNEQGSKGSVFIEKGVSQVVWVD